MRYHYRYLSFILVLIMLLSIVQLSFGIVNTNSQTQSTYNANDNQNLYNQTLSAVNCQHCIAEDEVQASSKVDFEELSDRLAELFNGNKGTSSQSLEQVYLGGYPLGMTLDGNGVRVVGLNEFIGLDCKVVCPAVDSGIKINDTIVEINGVKISNSVQLAEMAHNCDGQPLEIVYLRQGKSYTTSITPVQELSSRQYRIGLWTKDSSSGIGTLTYIKKDLQFGSLGHPIYDSDGNIIQVTDGGVYTCQINGVVKGIKGKAGELKGSFDFADKIGSIYLNNKYGVYGNFNKLPQYDNLQLIDVAPVSQVKVGKAYVYCTVDGTTPQYYEIEIVKANNQQTMDDKGMVLHITDSRLLDKTGGIVQGMSGSPIIQNGKLVGAVTHVFVNDPTRGYGVYAQWMLQN